jgi:aminoglycoside phosphotransferase (APT) family kinase protein
VTDQMTPAESPDAETSKRVQTRDREDVRRRLESWFTARLGPGAEPEVSGLDVPSSNGMSSDTVLFDLTHGGDGIDGIDGIDRGGADSGRGGRATERLVARLAPEASAVPVFPSYDFAMQFAVMRLVAERTGVPIPAPRWLETDPAALGTPFFVMDRVDGEVPPDVMPYTFGSWLSEGSAGDQARLQDATVGLLAQIHTIDPVNADLGFVQFARREPTALARHVGQQWDYYQWVADGTSIPVLEDGFAWLRGHWPGDDAGAVLSWGDSRIGNVLYRDFAPVAVLDWEMAAVAPRELDVGWLIYLHRFFQDLAVQMGLPGMADFMRLDDVAVAYERHSGHRLGDLRWYVAYAAVRHGIVMARVQRRMIHDGQAAAPATPDELVLHRDTIRAMISGSYLDSL